MFCSIFKRVLKHPCLFTLLSHRFPFTRRRQIWVVATENTWTGSAKMGTNRPLAQKSCHPCARGQPGLLKQIEKHVLTRCEASELWMGGKARISSTVQSPGYLLSTQPSNDCQTLSLTVSHIVYTHSSFQPKIEEHLYRRQAPLCVPLSCLQCNHSQPVSTLKFHSMWSVQWHSSSPWVSAPSPCCQKMLWAGSSGSRVSLLSGTSDLCYLFRNACKMSYSMCCPVLQLFVMTE